MSKETEYDFIIAGSGCAGLSLLYRILSEPSLQGKRIAVIDKEPKLHNDRTWCYWEEGNGLFESIVTHQWRTLEFLSTDFSTRFDLKKYRYKMIRGIDFYRFVLAFAKEFSNVHFEYDTITGIFAEELGATVNTTNGSFHAEYVFNSTKLFYPEIDENNSLLQHFTGWVVETEDPNFDPEVGTLMDFTLDQKHGDTFMYVLPTSPTEALIEYTLFTKCVLEKNQYEEALKNYISEHLGIDHYEIKHQEFGIIPMSKEIFPAQPTGHSKLINIGTAGGSTKASSGYTFQFIQKAMAEVVQNLKDGLSPSPKRGFRDKMFHWYDRTVLDVMLEGKMTGKEIFTIMFQKLDPENILAFLGNESSFKDELVIMNSLPRIPFTVAGIKQLF